MIPPQTATNPQPAQPELVPVIDVGGEHGAAPGQPGSQLLPVYKGPGNAPELPAGDDRVKKDFIAARAAAQTGDPWSKLDAAIGSQPGANKPAKPQMPAATPDEGAQQPPAGARDPLNTDDPIGRVLLNSAKGATEAQQQPEEGEEEDTGFSLGSALDTAAHVAKDVGVGAMETPQAVLRGMLGSVEQTAQSALSVGDAIDNVLPRWLSRTLSLGGALPGAAQYVAESAKEDKSEIPAPSTYTGAAMEQIAQFGTGLVGAGKVTDAAGLTGTGAKILKDVVAGATSMDPEAPRLSNLIDEVAPNFITDWLKAKPGTENNLMARLKSGLEFAGLGAAFEGIKQGLTAIKPMIKSGKPPLADAMTPATGEPSATTTATMSRQPRSGTMPPGVLGEPEAQPLVEITPFTEGAAEQVREQQAGMAPQAPGEAGAPSSIPPQQVADYLAGRNANNPVRVNLMRIGSGDDIRNILEQVAKTIPAPAVESNEATIAAADALGMSPSDFLGGYRGQNLNASETTAMRFVMDSSASQLIKFAQMSIDPATDSADAKAAFLRAFAIHRSLQQYFVNARAEAGRTLQAWSIMSQQRAGATAAVQKLIEQGGEDNINQMAADIASLDDPIKVSRLVAASERGNGRDTFLKTFYNVLLSNPRTVVKKLASDGTMAMWNLATSRFAESYGSGAVVPGETAQLAYGYVSSLRDGIRMAGKGLAAGESQFFGQFQTMDWMDKSRLSLLANGSPDLIQPDAPTQAGAAWLRAALPTSWIGAADDFAKYINYRAYLRTLAFRDAVSQGYDGQDLATHVARTLDNVPDSMHQQALAETLRSTFQEPLTGVAAQLEDIADNLNIPVAHTNFQIPAGRIVMPFIKTPVNIARWSYRNTALAKAFPSSSFQDELNSGGASRDMAMARVWLGSAVALGAMDFALNNTITGRGPSDPQLQRAWRAAGNEPYSIQLPGMRPVSYNLVEPLGLLFSSIADTFGIMKFAKDDGRENLAASLMFGTGNAMLSKTYMQGVANIFDAMNDPERTGDRVAQSFVMSFTSPQGVAALAHSIDPWVRSHRTLMENEESRLPIVSERLPPARTLWGDPIPQRDAYLPFMPSDNFVTKMLSPWQLGPDPQNVQPIDKWVWDNRGSFPRAQSNQLGLSKPSEFQAFPAGKGVTAQVHLTPKEYDRIQALAGNELKDPASGMGAKDYLNSLVTGANPNQGIQDTWDQSSPAMQAVIVQRVVNQFRNAARQQIREEFPDIEEQIQAGAQSRAMQLQGAH